MFNSFSVATLLFSEGILITCRKEDALLARLAINDTYLCINNSQSRELVLKLHEYFERELLNRAPLLPVTLVQERVTGTLGIGKNDMEYNKTMYDDTMYEASSSKLPLGKRWMSNNLLHFYEVGCFVVNCSYQFSK